MKQLGIRRERDETTGLAHAEAEIHIVETDGKCLIVAADLAKHALSHHLARTGDRREVPRTDGSRKIALARRLEILVGVADGPMGTHQHTRMLREAVAEVQLGTYDADFGPLKVAEHLRHEVGRPDLGVVVEQQEVLPAASAAPKLIRRE